MKRLTVLTFSLLTVCSTFNAWADKCDYLRNRPQEYQECLKGWDGTFNKSNAPTPWWKNSDPNSGSNSAPAEAPTLSKQQLIDLQQQRERQQREAELRAAEERRKEQEAATNIDAARKRANLFTQQGIDALNAGKPEEALDAFYKVLGALKGHMPWQINYRYYPQLYEGMGRASAQLKQFESAEIYFKKGMDEFAQVGENDVKTGAYGRALNALANFYVEQGRLDDALEILSNRFNKTQWVAYSNHPETIAAAKDYVRVKEKWDVAHKNTDSKGPLLAQAYRHVNAMHGPLHRGNYVQALKASDDALAWATEKNDAGLMVFAQRNKAKALMKLNRGGEASDVLKALLVTLDKNPPPFNKSEGFGDKQSVFYDVLGGLAEEHESSRAYGYAEPYRRRMIEIQEKTRGPEHVETIAALRALAINHERFGKYQDALALQQRAIALAEKNPDAQNQLPKLRKELLALYGLNKSGFSQEAFDVAVKVDWIIALRMLLDDASKSFNDKQYEQAVEKGEIALDFAQKHGPDNSYLGLCQHNLAVYYQSDKQYEKAEVLYKKALETFARVGEFNSSSLITTLREISSLYDLKKRYAEAEPLYQRLLPLQEKKHGLEHPEVAKTLTKLANIHEREKRFAEAEAHFKRALAIAEKQVPVDESLLIRILGGLAWVYRDTRREEEAIRLEQRREKLL